MRSYRVQDILRSDFGRLSSGELLKVTSNEKITVDSKLKTVETRKFFKNYNFDQKWSKIENIENIEKVLISLKTNYFLQAKSFKRVDIIVKITPFALMISSQPNAENKKESS